MLINLIAHIESEQNCNSLKWSFKRWRAQGLGIYPNWALFDYDLNEEKNWRLKLTGICWNVDELYGSILVDNTRISFEDILRIDNADGIFQKDWITDYPED